MLRDFIPLWKLTIRDVKLFFKDKATVFFSLLGPIIVLLVYILFLADIQIDSVLSSIPEGITVDINIIKSYIDSWMIAGVLSIACVSVSLSANTIMVKDKETGVLNDLLSSPIKRWSIKLSYFVYNLIITLSILFIVLIICLIYLAASGRWNLSVGDFFGVIGTVLLSTFSATLITVFISDFFRTEAQLGAFVGITSSVIGFIMGAYMPMSLMPNAVQYISSLLPASHSTGLFRHFLMSGPLEKMAEVLPQEVVDGLSEAFTMKINFFGKSVGVGIMASILAISIVVFLAVNILVISKHKKNKIKRIKLKK